MKPIMFTIPGINWNVPGYGTMLMIGFLLSIAWAARRAAKSRANPDVILNLGFVALISGVVGSRFMYVVHYWDHFRHQGSTIKIIIAILDVRQGGLEFYGGFVLTVIVVLWWLHFKEKVSIRWYLDIVAPSAALGLAIGRIGCFFNGCCFGGTCELPWAVHFPFGSPAGMHQWEENIPGAALPEELLFVYPNGATKPIARDFLNVSDEAVEAAEAEELGYVKELAAVRAKLKNMTDPEETRKLGRQATILESKRRSAMLAYAEARANMRRYGLTVGELKDIARKHSSLPVHPTQLYSTITALLIALFLNAFYWHRTRDGQLICLLLLIEPLTRWMLEVIRADNPIDALGVFTISQFLAVLMTVAGLVGLIVLHYLPPRSPRARPWEPEDEEVVQAARPAKTGGAAS